METVNSEKLNVLLLGPYPPPFGGISSLIVSLIGGLKSSMGYLGSKTKKDLQKKGEFVKITKAGFYESMVHNVDHVKKNESQ